MLDGINLSCYRAAVGELFIEGIERDLEFPKVVVNVMFYEKKHEKLTTCIYSKDIQIKGLNGKIN